MNKPSVRIHLVGFPRHFGPPTLAYPGVQLREGYGFRISQGFCGKGGTYHSFVPQCVPWFPMGYPVDPDVCEAVEIPNARGVFCPGPPGTG